LKKLHKRKKIALVILLLGFVFTGLAAIGNHTEHGMLAKLSATAAIGCVFIAYLVGKPELWREESEEEKET